MFKLTSPRNCAHHCARVAAGLILGASCTPADEGGRQGSHSVAPPPESASAPAETGGSVSQAMGGSAALVAPAAQTSNVTPAADGDQVLPSAALPSTSPAAGVSAIAMATMGIPPAGVGAPAPQASAGSADVVFSLERGWYTGSQTLALSAAQPGAEILYAVGGELPKTLYGAPITLTDTGGVVTVRARLSVDGAQQGKLITHSYVFMPDLGSAVVVINDSDLPVAPGKSERPVTFEFIPSPQTGLSSVVDECATAPSMGGQGSGLSDKFYFRGEYGKGTLHGDLFSDLYYGVPPTDRHDHLFLRSDHGDRSLLRQVLAHDALLAMGQLSPHGRFVDFYDNGQLKGTRYLVERPEGGFMESYTGIDKPHWLAVSGVDAIGTSLDVGTEYGSWADLNAAVNVESLIDFLIVQWHANVSDYLPTRKNWRATGPIDRSVSPDSDAGPLPQPIPTEPEYRWHFFNWDMDRGYQRTGTKKGSPMNILDRIDQFSEVGELLQRRSRCAFSPGGPLSSAVILERLKARYAQLQATTQLRLVSHIEDLEPEGLEPGTLVDINADAMLFLTQMETWLPEQEEVLLSSTFPGGRGTAADCQ